MREIFEISKLASADTSFLTIKMNQLPKFRLKLTRLTDSHSKVFTYGSIFACFSYFFVFRRFPFSQIYLLKPEIEGQSLGILNYNNTPEIREIVPGSVAAAAGN